MGCCAATRTGHNAREKARLPARTRRDDAHATPAPLRRDWVSGSERPAGRFRERRPADPREELFPLPRRRRRRKGDWRSTPNRERLAGGDNGPAIVPGKSAESRLFRFVAGLDDENVMPPDGDDLPASQVAVLKAWIDQGAKWPDSETATNRPAHWAFQKPVRPALPAVKNPANVRNPIDAFVLARLDKEGLSPSPEADKATLIRRVSLDLTGLPPTVEEVDAFLADRDPGEYERLVDRLLASPAFGERWARFWLDLARFADTNGYEKDRERSVWPYRDWVIQALNADMPFDRFTIDQIAGDLRPDADVAAHIATGFHRNTMVNEEGGIDVEEFRFASMVDRVNTTGAVWLGLTLGCCQCHSHKYDPLTQREYYQMMAFLITPMNLRWTFPTQLSPARARSRADSRAGTNPSGEIPRRSRRAVLAKQEAWEASQHRRAGCRRPSALLWKRNMRRGWARPPVHPVHGSGR